MDDWRAAKTLKERLAWVMAAKELKPTPWSTEAGLSHGYINAFMGRGDGADMKTSEVSALARAAGVSAGWLATGEGEPDVTHAPAPDSYSVEHDARYPNLEEALRKLAPGLHEETDPQARTVALNSTRDLTFFEWSKIIHRIDEYVRLTEANPAAVAAKLVTAETAPGADKLGPPPAKWVGGKRPKK